MLFMKSLEVIKLHCVRHRQVDFMCSSRNILTTIQNQKRVHQSLGSPAMMGLPENCLVCIMAT